MVSGKEVSITFGIFLYLFVLLGRSGLSIMLLTMFTAIAILVVARKISKRLKKISLWHDLLSGERFILIDCLAILILVLIPVIGLEELSPYAPLAYGLRISGLKILTRALGIALVGWTGNTIVGKGIISKINLILLPLQRESDKQLVTYLILFPAELITILLFKKTFITWLLQAFWLERDYAFLWEILILAIGLILLLWGRTRRIRHDAKIASRVQWI